jgi:hypothetical protein
MRKTRIASEQRLARFVQGLDEEEIRKRGSPNALAPEARHQQSGQRQQVTDHAADRQYDRGGYQKSEADHGLAPVMATNPKRTQCKARWSA